MVYNCIKLADIWIHWIDIEKFRAWTLNIWSFYIKSTSINRYDIYSCIFGALFWSLLRLQQKMSETFTWAPKYIIWLVISQFQWNDPEAGMIFVLVSDFIPIVEIGIHWTWKSFGFSNMDKENETTNEHSDIIFFRQWFAKKLDRPAFFDTEILDSFESTHKNLLYRVTNLSRNSRKEWRRRWMISTRNFHLLISRLLGRLQSRGINAFHQVTYYSRSRKK